MKKDLELFQRLSQKLLEAEVAEPVVTPIPAEELYQRLDLSLSEDPVDEAEFEKVLGELVLNTPRSATRLFFNQLFGGRTPKATLGDLMAVMLNNSMYTYKVAGPQVGVEKEILRQVCQRIGYGTQADGTFAPGGSMSNFVAMLMARDEKDPDFKHNGSSSQLIAYTSTESHYSTSKNAAFCGIGRNQVRYIECNDHGEMIPEALRTQVEKDLQQGHTPFFVNATAGTTVLGAFDAIEPLADICEAYHLWLHVDGAYCGSVIFSKKYDYLVRGLERTQSFSFNAHKMLGTPLSSSIIVTQNRKHLHDSLSNDAAYLYQTDGDEYNLGKTSIQCGRRNDALKLWTLWKSAGTRGLEKMVDHQFHLADVARDYIRQHDDYTLYSYDGSISVCFNYKNIPAQTLCTALYQAGEIMVGFGSFREDEFVRLVTINSGNEEADIINFFTTLEAFVEKNPHLLPSEMMQQS